MRTKVQRWGNSLAVRIPKSLAEDAGLKADSAVDIRLGDGGLVVQPAPPPAPSLDELLGGVRDSNLHGEIDAGPAQGREAW